MTISYLLAALALAAVSAWSARRFGNTVNPATVFSGLWALLLLVLAASDGRFYAVPGQALLIFVLGAVAFSGAATVMWRVDARGRLAVDSAPAGDERYFRILLRTGFLLMAASLPLYYRYAADLAAAGGSDSFLYSIRRGAILMGDRPVSEIHYTPVYVYVINLPQMALLLALIAVAECGYRQALRRDAAALLVLSGVYALLTASIAPFVWLVGGVIGIVAAQRREIPLRLAVIAAGGLLISFSSIAIATRKVGSLTQIVLLYLVGGLVAFGRAIANPAAVAPNWSIWRFFQLTLNKFGAQIPVPSLHLAYTEVGPGTILNVYTMYFAYFPGYGYAGMAILAAMAGAVSAAIFSRAVDGHPGWQVAYGIVVASIVTTGFNEPFWMNLNFHLKSALALIVVYTAPLAVRAAGGRALQRRPISR